jgi:DNA/RNA-binding domain of Phe-tRNA-synthetase-like protein
VLPNGVEDLLVTIDEELKKKCPRAALGCVWAGVTASAASAELTGEMDAAVAKILALPEPKAVLEGPAVLATRRGYKTLGKDPARYRGSAEALLRRVISGKGLPQINTVVDTINLVSVESRLPIGLYDLAQVRGDVVFRAGRAGETYKGIGKYDLNLESLPLFADAEGPHGSATSDSERTMVTIETKEVLAIMVSFAGAEGLAGWMERLKGLLEKYVSGRGVRVEVVA